MVYFLVSNSYLTGCLSSQHPLVHHARTGHGLVENEVKKSGRRCKSQSPIVQIPTSSITPLQTRLSNKAPRSAKIISRNAASAAVIPSYNLKIGDSILRNITLDEIYDFVSPQDLHVFEHAAFRRENSERDKRLLEAALHRATHRKRGRGGGHHTVSRSGSSSASSGDESDSKHFDTGFLRPPPIEIGRHGRPRPEYGQFYLKRGRARGRGRGGIVPGGHSSLSPSDRESSGTTRGRGRGRGGRGRGGRPRGSRGLGRLDVRDGESADEVQDEEGLWEAASVLSLEEPMKKRRLDAYEYDSFRKRDVTAPTVGDRRRRETKTITPVLPSEQRKKIERQRSPATLPLNSIGLDEGLSDSSSVVSSSSSLSSSAYQASRRKGSAGEEVEDDDEPEYEIDRILSHQLSDPATHPPELGQGSVMLYQVKWVGYDEPTWEPVSSFVDQKVVREYWARVKGKSPAK